MHLQLLSHTAAAHGRATPRSHGNRKRAGGDDAADAFRKRGPAAATGQEGAYYSQGPSQEDAAMVM